MHDMNGRITHDRDENAGWTHFRLHLPMVTNPPRRPVRAASQETGA
jgi:two-component system nitrogen regulation sensor histidine kinase GlnL